MAEPSKKEIRKLMDIVGGMPAAHFTVCELETIHKFLSSRSQIDGGLCLFYDDVKKIVDRLHSLPSRMS